VLYVYLEPRKILNIFRQVDLEEYLQQSSTNASGTINTSRALLP
jgi:hypothetical protein